MNILGGYVPTNEWLVRELDKRWRAWLTRCLIGAVAIGLSLAALVGPRQTLMRSRYEIAQLTREIERLGREQRRLVLEREALSSPSVLAGQVQELGLECVPRERTIHLTVQGHLQLAAASGRAPRAGGAHAAEPR